MKLSTVVEESLGEGESVLAYSQSTIAVVVNVLTKGISITDKRVMCKSGSSPIELMPLEYQQIVGLKVVCIFLPNWALNSISY